MSLFLFPFKKIFELLLLLCEGVVDGVLLAGHLRQHSGADHVGTERDGAQQATDADAQVSGVERPAGRDGQLHPDALADLHAQPMGPHALLLRRPRLLARLRTRIRGRGAGHGRRAMVRSHQTFHLSNGNRIAIAPTTTTYTKAKRQRAKPIPFVLYEILTIRPSLKSRPAVGLI